MTTTQKIEAIEAAIKAEARAMRNFNNLHNEGGEGYVDETRMEQLTADLLAAKAEWLRENLATERAAFNAKGFTGRDLQAANKWCTARGYSLGELQAACKAAK